MHEISTYPPVHFPGTTSLVTISTADARRAGIDISNVKAAQAQTASGIVPFYPVVLNSLKIGDIELLNVPAGVLETNNSIALLGGSFLNRMEMKRDGNTLTLKKRY